MLVIGERINSTRPRIREMIKLRKADAILKEAALQLQAGADFIDINCAVTPGDEVQDIDWIVSVIQSGIKDFNLCIDSPNYLAIERALKVYKGAGNIIVNSITGEEERIDRILPLALHCKAKLVALTMSEKGMPSAARDRRDIAKSILERVTRSGFKAEDLYFDPLIRPISTEPEQAKEFLKSIPLIKALGPVKTICGLSNISFGLPHRTLINSTFLAMMIHSGLDAAILDPTDKHIVASMTAAKAIMCDDAYCAEYIKAFREGKLA